MTALITSIASVAGEFLRHVSSIILIIALFVFGLPILWDLFNLPTISLNDDIISSLSSIHYIYSLVNHFLPVNFIIGCLLIIFTFRFAIPIYHLCMYLLSILKR